MAAGLVIPTARAANGFGDGNLVIYRVGDGSVALGSAATPVFLDEYTTSGVFVQSIAMPTSVAGANRRLTASGTATSEGLLTRSADGRYLVATGYDAAVGTANITASPWASINRVIARVDAAGVLDTTTALTDAVSGGGSPRSAVSTNGSDLWISGSAAGVRYAPLGATTSVAVATTVPNLRQAQIFGGQLFVSSASGSLRLGTVGTGTPTATGQSITNLPGFPTTSGSPYSFWFADLSPVVEGLDTLYVADDGSTQNGGGVQKYSLVSGVWFLNGTTAPAGVRGLTGTVANGIVTLYATSGTTLVTITDNSGYGAPIGSASTTLLTAPANVAFRGVALAPAAVTPPPSTTTSPFGAGTATPSTFTTGSTTTLTVAVTKGTNPDSTNLVVTADLSAFGGSASQQLFDDGVAPDGTAGDLTFSASAAITASPGAHSIPFTITDAQARSTAGTIAITVEDAATPPAVAISQIYGGGGNTGASYRNDFIEVFNRGTTAVNLSGWTVQYTSAAGSSWQTTALTGTLQPNQYYLVQENAGAGGTQSLPAPDATGTINMAASAGKVALVRAATALSGACPTGTAIVDFVGFGSAASCFEGTGPAAAPGNTTAIRRTGGSGGCTDTENNNADFFTGSPVPRNTAALGQCSVIDTAIPLAIHDIQGSTPRSSYEFARVSTTGVVTGRKSNGFYLQALDSEADADPNTSEGVFVFTSSAPPAAATPGTYVGVTATVQEFVPSADPASPSVTELINPVVTFSIAGFALPAPVVITAADATPTSGIFNLEKYEGMRVSIPSLTVIAPTGGSVTEANATSTTNGVFYGVITQTPALPRPMREPGIQLPEGAAAPSSIPRYDANPERIRVDSDALIGAAPINVATGAIVTGLVGPLDYSFRSYTVLPEPATPPTVSGGIAVTAVPATAAREFTVASFNMERFFDTVDDAGISDVALTPAAFDTRLNKASLAIRDVLRLPDIIGVEEMENLTTLQAVGAKVNADAMAAGHPNPQYEAILLEGNDIGGIDVGVLYKTGRVTVDSQSVVQIGKDATFVQPDGVLALLNDRPSLLVKTTVHVPGAAEFPLTLIVNHLRSLSGVDNAVDGDRVRHKRRAQAEYLANYVQALQSANPAERIVLVGDFNAFTFNDGYVDVMGTIKGRPTPADQVLVASADLVDPDLIDLVETAPADQQYSFVFDGVAQELDHVLITQNLLPFAPRLEYGRTNADFPEVYRGDSSRPERISDHDPIVAYFTAPALTTITYTGGTTVEAGSLATVSALLLDQTTLAPIVGEPVTFSADAGSAAAITDAAGSASATLALPLGSHVVTVAFAGDASRLLAASTTTATIAVLDTTPPAIASVTPSTASLWPPNKLMVPVTMTVVAADAVDPAVVCRVTSIGSNEGRTADRMITGPLSVALRADRNGSGSGRIYRITVGCRDASGNRSTASTQVVVPHDQR